MKAEEGQEGVIGRSVEEHESKGGQQDSDRRLTVIDC